MPRFGLGGPTSCAAEESASAARNPSATRLGIRLTLAASLY
jgi:hypothetical protein